MPTFLVWSSHYFSSYACYAYVLAAICYLDAAFRSAQGTSAGCDAGIHNKFGINVAPKTARIKAAIEILENWRIGWESSGRSTVTGVFGAVNSFAMKVKF
jgi:hypothetical protein